MEDFEEPMEEEETVPNPKSELSDKLDKILEKVSPKVSCLHIVLVHTFTQKYYSRTSIIQPSLIQISRLSWPKPCPASFRWCRTAVSSVVDDKRFKQLTLIIHCKPL